MERKYPAGKNFRKFGSTSRSVPEVLEQPENADPMVHLPRAPDCRFINFNILGQNSVVDVIGSSDYPENTFPFAT